MLKIITLLACFFFIFRRTRFYLRLLQQEDYMSGRLLRWLWRTRTLDTKGSIAALLGWYITPIALVVIGLLESDPRKKGKLTLKMTTRAKRIFFVTQAVLLVGIVMLYPLPTRITTIFLVQATPLLLVCSNLLLTPFEKRTQRRFMAEAKKKLAFVDPFVIGITGSYGKTGTKHALGRLLQMSVGSTFWPAKGINTPMGITRELRNRLHRGYDYAVVEMGAYGRGSIARLCALTPPKAAIITTIGEAHLERFGSIETTRLAKSELAQALPADGILVCNGDDPRTRQIADEHRRQTTLLFGFGDDVDCRIVNYELSNRGTEFVVQWRGRQYKCATTLLGRTAVMNIVAAYTMACALGADPEYAATAIATLEPVDNRLVLQEADDVTYLHNGYSSNPTGFLSALETLEKVPGQRKILITPGMIELGKEQYARNLEMGRLAARCCDLALIVGKTNADALVAGAKGAGLKEVICTATRDEAFAKLRQLKQKGDVVLIENDLTDLYEQKVRL